MNPIKLSSDAIAFEFINRPEYKLIIPGSRTRSTVSSFVLFKNEEAMLEELPKYGNSFIVDKYSNVYYELLDYLIEEPSFLNELANIAKVPLECPETYIALAVQKPYGFKALGSFFGNSYEIVTTRPAGKEIGVDSSIHNRTRFDFFFKCETTQMLTYELDEDEKIFSLDSVLESCAYQLMYLSKECALGCALCQKGVGYDNS